MPLTIRHREALSLVHREEVDPQIRNVRLQGRHVPVPAYYAWLAHRRFEAPAFVAAIIALALLGLVLA